MALEIEISGCELYLSNLDSDNEVNLITENDSLYVDKESAIAIIAHLQKEFGL